MIDFVDENKEEWRDIPGYEGLYQASNKGRIRSVPRKQEIMWKGKHVVKYVNGKIIKQSDQKCGYMMVWLSKDGKEKAHTVHRLIGYAFLENPENLSDINHKDGNKKNNCVDNLEWCSRSDNIKHRYAVLQKPGKCRPVICVETGKRYDSIAKAAKSINGNRRAISHAIRGFSKTSGGFHWKYET